MYLVCASSQFFLGVWVARLLSPITEIEGWIPGFYEFMKDHEGSGDLASVAILGASLNYI